MKNKTRQKIGTLSSLIVALAFGLSNEAAKATANGCSYFGTDGETCIRVVGGGLEVNSVTGSFTIGSFQTSICNWRYTLTFMDKNNNRYTSATGPLHRSCNKSGTFTMAYNTKPFIAREGRICANLYKNTSTYVDAACVNITD